MLTECPAACLNFPSRTLNHLHWFLFKWTEARVHPRLPLAWAFFSPPSALSRRSWAHGSMAWLITLPPPLPHRRPPGCRCGASTSPAPVRGPASWTAPAPETPTSARSSPAATPRSAATALLAASALAASPTGEAGGAVQCRAGQGAGRRWGLEVGTWGGERQLYRARSGVWGTGCWPSAHSLAWWILALEM